MSGRREDVDEQGLPRDLAWALELALSGGLLVSASLLVAGLVTQSSSLLHAGILLMLFTPVARVVVLTVGLFHERDFLFACISLWILLVLLSSVRIGSLF